MSFDVAGTIPGGRPNSFLFPYHKIGLAGNSRLPVLYDVDLMRPMGSWRKAWRIASKAAGVRYRPHDMRHTFISRLAENPNVSEQTIKALAGHVSRQMIERYSHIRSQAKQAAIQTLEQPLIEPIWRETGHKNGHSDVQSVPIPAVSFQGCSPDESAKAETQANSLKTVGGPARI
ncbi:MAG TPA: tyrosine-type recombinase/integrase [Candidatus Dormibacteraeota bacterium]|nr:tyrosine-type recombinase/integrase [Candidatus Dormibacteraeota bacterium]